MIKKWIYYTSILVVVAFISSGFKKNANENQDWFFSKSDTNSLYLYPSKNSADYNNQGVFLNTKSFTGYKEAIAFKESQGRYNLVNTFGYMGKYQFGKSALKALGITNTAKFLKSPELQERAFTALLSKNKWILEDEIEKYDGTVVSGIQITESGILAAAHLLGAGSVKKFFRTNGNARIVDGYGTSLKSYLKKYSGYETSFIIADDNPMVE